MHERPQTASRKYAELFNAGYALLEQIIAIDVHTDLKKYGENTLLAEPKDYDALHQMFGERVASSEPEKSPAYRVRGGIDSMIPRVLGKAQVYCLCQEFGTYSSASSGESGGHWLG